MLTNYYVMMLISNWCCGEC